MRPEQTPIHEAILEAEMLKTSYRYIDETSAKSVKSEKTPVESVAETASRRVGLPGVLYVIEKSIDSVRESYKDPETRKKIEEGISKLANGSAKAGLEGAYLLSKGVSSLVKRRVKGDYKPPQGPKPHRKSS